jgi:signal transduction histidine kinase
VARGDLVGIVRLVIALSAARAAAANVEIRAELSPVGVSADGDLLVRAIGNLVANALEAMPQGGVLTLRTTTASGLAAVEVEDTGPGLTDEQRAHLFTPYFTTKPGGTGLGLAIVQGIASDHGGRVEVLSASPRGTVFSLVLPICV